MRWLIVFLCGAAVAACSSNPDDAFPSNVVVMQPSVTQDNAQCDAVSSDGKAPGQACKSDADCVWTCCACTDVPLATVMTDDCDGTKLAHVLGTSFSSRQCIRGVCADHDGACAYAAAQFHMCRCTHTGEL
jgi:hypothetical protein